MQRRYIATLGLCLLLTAGGLQAFERQHTYSLPPGSGLRISMRAGDLSIEGGNDTDIHVKVVADDRNSPEEIKRRLKVRFTEGRAESRLTIGGLKNLTVRVVLPFQTNLRVELFAGELSIRGLRGDLMTRMFAGETNIELPTRSLYKSVQTRVRVGDLSHPFTGDGSGWLGKTYEANFSQGRYRLDARVAVGDLSIKESTGHAAER